MSDPQGVDSSTAVIPLTASDADPPRPDPGPTRTCIGCRRRAAATELLRVVVSERSVRPDPRRRAPGRGAWVHPDPACLDLAERRRAYGRALRADGPLDPAPVRAYVRQLSTSSSTSSTTPTSGTPQE